MKKQNPITMGEIARQAGVSKNTVSLALRNSPLLSASTRSRISEVAKELGYQKNAVVAHLMAQLRSARSPGFKAPLALLNANLDKDAFRRHPTIPIYVEGCRHRATELGYSVDEFWLHDPDLTTSRLSRIFKSRNIRGAIIVGLMNENRLPERFAPFWPWFPFVVTGVRTQDPTLSFAVTDHHALALKAFEKALQLGYQRPALVLDHVIDKLVDGRFSSGVHIAQQQLPEERRTKPFYLVNEARKQPELFKRWLEQEKPDLILTLYHVVQKWLTDLGYRLPQEMGLIQLEWRPDHPDWSGMDQHNDVVGAAAVDMVVGMIHNGSSGIPAFPQANLIGSTWIAGETAKAIGTHIEAKLDRNYVTVT